jgi:hypothetical protein
MEILTKIAVAGGRLASSVRDLKLLQPPSMCLGPGLIIKMHAYMEQDITLLSIPVADFECVGISTSNPRSGIHHASRCLVKLFRPLQALP